MHFVTPERYQFSSEKKNRRQHYSISANTSSIHFSVITSVDTLYLKISKKQTPLKIAQENGRSDIVKYLMNLVSEKMDIER